jgi:hypothetical protein
LPRRFPRETVDLIIWERIGGNTIFVTPSTSGTSASILIETRITLVAVIRRE